MYHLGRVVAATLVFAPKAAVFLLGIAIVVGNWFRPADHFGARDKPGPQSFRYLEDTQHARIYMQPPKGHDTSHLVVHDPSGKEVMMATYHTASGVSYFHRGGESLRTCLWTKANGVVHFCANTRESKSEFEIRPDDEGGMVLIGKSARGTRVSEVRISAEGEASIVPIGR